MEEKQEENSVIMEAPKPRNFVAKNAHQINKSGKIVSKREKARRRNQKHQHRADQ
jgi:hypothetical protein